MSKKEILEECYRSDSQYRLNPFLYDQNALAYHWEVDELLELLSGADVPMAQKGFEVFYEAMLEAMPKYDGEDLMLYRGTSLETIEEYGAGLFWTTNRKTALDFANMCVSIRYKIVFGAIDKTPCIISRLATPEEIMYHYTNTRLEDEVFLKMRDEPYDYDEILTKENGGLV
jgi:hypothetical protein